MKRIITYICLTLFAMSVSLAQNVVVRAEVDSMMMWVGQQTGLHLEVTCDAGQEVRFPVYRDTIVKGLEIIPPVVTDTQYVNNGKRMTIKRSYTVTCFDSTIIYISSIPVQVDGDDYESNRLALAFMTYDIPEGQETQIFGPKDNMGMPIKFYELKGIILFCLLAAVACVVAIYLLMRYRDDRPIIKRIKIEPKVPAHIRAISEIEKLKQSGGPRSEDAKGYYTQLTDILREYMNDRFGFNATEMTSYEIMERLEGSWDKDSLNELRDLLSTSDMVKFAKFKPMLNENDRNLVSALEFVNGTKIEVPESELQPKEKDVIVEMKRSRGARAVLLATGIVLAVSGFIFLIVFIIKMYYLFF